MDGLDSLLRRTGVGTDVAELSGGLGSTVTLMVRRCHGTGTNCDVMLRFDLGDEETSAKMCEYLSTNDVDVVIMTPMCGTADASTPMTHLFATSASVRVWQRRKSHEATISCEK